MDIQISAMRKASCLLIFAILFLVNACATTTSEEAASDEILSENMQGTAPEVDEVPVTEAPVIVEEEKEGIDFILEARYGHYKVVEYNLYQGADIDQQDELGNTALIAVAATDNKDVLELLVERGADVHIATNDGTTALMNAAASGHLDNVKYLIDAGAQINRTNHDGESALVYAIKFGHKDIVDYLLKNGADANIYDQDEITANNRFTPLMIAAEYGFTTPDDATIVRRLLAHGADPKVHRNNGDTALSIAEKNRNEAIVDELEKHGARDETPYAGLTAEDALLKAIKMDDVAKVRELLDTAADSNYRETLTGVTPLLMASYYGNPGVVNMLVEKGADIDDVPWGLTEQRINASSVPVNDRELMRIASRGDTALITAIRRGHTRSALLLLDHGADVLQPNRKAETPGYFAARKGNAAVMRSLLDKGLDPNRGHFEQVQDYFSDKIIHEEDTRPLLIEAADLGHVETVRALLGAGADPDLQDALGRTALFLAVSQGFADTVKVLLEMGADPDLKEATGKTPLMMAAKNGFRRIVTLLLEHEADINAIEDIENSFGEVSSQMTALGYAVRGGHTAIVGMLLEHGADPSLRNHDGETAFDIARKNGYSDILAMLSEPSS
ncbi:MAG TPA: hypothetical protein ENJ22_06070 [Gammaproteobacteria bacterium]|nr:hypothetical protein [Gammaproteobacteria bacterium]